MTGQLKPGGVDESICCMTESCGWVGEWVGLVGR